MKKLIVILTMCLGLTNICYAQQPAKRAIQIKNKQIVNILASVDTLIYRSTNHLVMYIYNIENGYNSAHTKGADEITHKILIALSDGDDAAEKHVFELGNYFDPKFLEINTLNGDSFSLTIMYGSINKKKKVTYHISLRKVVRVD